MNEYSSFLNGKGQIIFGAIKENCNKLGLWEADDFEIAMLANSFALYAKCADFCNQWGVSMSFRQGKKKTGKAEDLEDDEDLAPDELEGSGKAEAGIYQQVRPEYTVMKNEYNNILKHSGKFGLNPGDRARLFKKISEPKEKKKGFNLVDDKMKVA